MRIISFSNAATQPFWALPVQALAPWIVRIRHSLGHIAALPTGAAALRMVDAVRQPFAPETATASNDSVFAPFHEAALRPEKPSVQSHPSVLRVVRESDSAISADCAGRMVISGRMADVCAELDRMAERAMAVASHSAQ